MPSLLAMAVPPDLKSQLRRAARQHRHWEAERDRLVVEARHAGGSLREIAELIGLTHPGVRRIEKRQR